MKKDETIGYRDIIRMTKYHESRVPCKNAHLCRHYMNKGARIYSKFCPYGCEFYIPATAIIAERKEAWQA